MGAFDQLIFSFLELVKLIFHPFILIPTVIIIAFLFKKNKEYKDSNYYQITKHPYRLMRGDAGLYGEYLTYKKLKHFEKNGARFLFNTYIPKENGETTEIDVLMICSKGVFVFESKNYSGWIFGSEGQKYWYQTLPAGYGKSHKEKFFNPVIQNRLHIKYLKSFFGEQIKLHSIVVFSNRCTLKNVQINSSDVSLIKRDDVDDAVSAICSQIVDEQLTEKDICEVYNKLYPLTQVDEITKARHIENIYNKIEQNALKDKTACEPHVDLEETSDVVVEKNDVSFVVDEVNANLNSINVKISPEEKTSTETRKLQCPWCSGNLVLRTTARGANVGNRFYGCSNYPRCKYIKNYIDKLNTNK